MREAFPEIVVTTEVFEIDRDRYTSSGGSAPLDMMPPSLPPTMVKNSPTPYPKSLSASEFAADMTDSVFHFETGSGRVNPN